MAIRCVSVARFANNTIRDPNVFGAKSSRFWRLDTGTSANKWEAAHWAASARNVQPWRFVVVQGKKEVEALAQAFLEQNMIVKEAPVIIIACGRPADDVIRDGKEYYLLDIGMAEANMLLAATDLGLVTHPMTGLNETEVKRILQIPDDVRIVIATPLAYPLEVSYDEAAKERLSQRTRKDPKEVAYLNGWSGPEPA